MLDRIATEAAALCRADLAFVFLREGELIHFVAGIGGSPEHVDYERTHSIPATRDTVAGRVLLENAPVHIHDVLEDNEYRWPGQTIDHYRTLLGVPIRTDAGLIGAFGIARMTVSPFSDDEIELVSLFGDQAAVAIRLARMLETIDRQRTELARYAPQAAELLTSIEGKQLLAGHRRDITALFADLRGFTAFAERAEPEEVLDVLRQYHAVVGGLAVANGGTVEHFAGDGLMVFFNDPTPVPAHQLAAVRTACAMREQFDALSSAWRKRGYELGLGIGIATGFATLGRIGFEGRYDYAAIGNSVILASRLSAVATAGQILASQRVFAAVEDLVEADTVNEVALKGISQALTVYAITALRS
jgi:class 3 adenylate cyclase